MTTPSPGTTAIPRLTARDDNRVLRALGAVGPFLALLAACVFFATRSDRFLTGDNLSIVLQQVMVVGVLAIGQTLVILCGSLDLSVPYVVSLSSLIAADTMKGSAANIAPAVLAAVVQPG